MRACQNHSLPWWPPERSACLISCPLAAGRCTPGKPATLHTAALLRALDTGTAACPGAPRRDRARRAGTCRAWRARPRTRRGTHRRGSTAAGARRPVCRDGGARTGPGRPSSRQLPDPVSLGWRAGGDHLRRARRPGRRWTRPGARTGPGRTQSHGDGVPAAPRPGACWRVMPGSAPATPPWSPTSSACRPARLSADRRAAAAAGGAERQPDPGAALPAGGAADSGSRPLHQLKGTYKWWFFAHPEWVNMRISSNAYA